MKTYKTKALALLVLSFMLVLSACSTGNSNNGGSTAAAEDGQAAAGGNAKTDDGKAEKKLKIGLTVPTLGNPFFVAMSKGAEEVAAKYNAEVIVVSADHDLAKQTQQFEDFITQKVDLILLSPFDSKGIAAAVQQAKAAGIPVVALDGNAEGGIDSVVMSDNVQAGRLAGEYLAKRLNGKGNIVIIDGPPVSAVIDRIKGFNEVLAQYPDIKVVANQNGEGNREKTLTLMENVLQANKQIDAVFCINDEEGVGAKIAQEQAGRSEEFFIVGVDGAPSAADAIKEKKSYAATSAQFPNQMAIQGVELARKVINGETVEPQILIPTELITQDNVDSYKGW
ncbi:ribose transport system substrate-binding protein [Paenibacillus phyllosphaerae]|uniref:Ribose transport system substrate-binding protein n=1 Tax=Paenibacillus phyllosphaerae TaxID=274593 RepID=A0A7W5FKP3_9BACL|nr:ABC transporter substrate-binding protein [Paenibacillus phyllosphaerae]MBB3108179.1 ribose transport system substrate-binding protein [Paenibacillus phyllosphaerae]